MANPNRRYQSKSSSKHHPGGGWQRSLGIELLERARPGRGQGLERSRLSLELLESRALLSIQPALTTDFSSLLLDRTSFDASSVLVRFASENIAQASATGVVPGANLSSQVGILPGLHAVNLPANVSVNDALAMYRATPGVVYAEPNYRLQLKAQLIPNDPLYNSLYGMNNIKAYQAWATTTGNPNTIVAVIDTGVDYNHPDLSANIWTNPGEIPGNHLDDDHNGFVDDVHGYDFINGDGDPMDDHGHGTHVSGTIAAVGDNGIGVVGVNWTAKIMALKFLDSAGSGTTADAIAALNYAVANGATISNNSYSGSVYSQAFVDAITAAKSAGHIFVAAAGNDGLNIDNAPAYPASFNLDNVISVAATNSTDNLAGFSNYGLNSVDVAAPGVSILSTVPGGYAYLSGTSMATPHVAGVVALVRGQHPEWTYQQVVDRVLGTADPLANLTGTSVTGARLNAVAAVDSGPEIWVRLGQTTVIDGSSSFNFGSAFTGVPLVKTFTVKNIGTQDLTLTGPITLPAGFSLISGFGATTVVPGGSTTFAVQLDASVAGTYSGQLSFANNDADEGIFNFTLQGSVAGSKIIDDGDAAYSVSGPWTPYQGVGFQSDVRYAFSGVGGSVSKWSFADVPAGMYRVAATWAPWSGRASNAPYSVYDGASFVSTTLVNQLVAPNQFNDAGAAWNYLTPSIAITSGSVDVRLSNNANGVVIADGVRLERIGNIVLAPDVQVLDGQTDIVNGLGSVNFGAILPGTTATKTLTVKNVGTQSLNLGSLAALPTGFSLASSFGTTSLNPGASTTFAIKFNASTVGNYSGQISFDSNDPDENPFQFTVSGVVSTTRIMDDGDTGFSATNGFTFYQGTGYQNDVRYALAGNGSNVAKWTFANVSPGIYRVAATWSPYSGRASNAPYSIYDGASSLGTVQVNQLVAPNQFNDSGAAWNYLGQTYSITATTLEVRLSDNANGVVIADGVRIERIGDLPQGPEIQVLDGAVDIANALGSVNFGTTLTGTAVTRTFTVKNLGTQDLLLGTPITLPAGFSLASDFGATTLTPGSSTTFAIKFNASVVGTASGQVSFGTNDADEAPFQFSVSAVASNTLIMDDGDAGYSSNNGFVYYQGTGYLNDVRYALAGNGASVAKWTFANVSPGLYRVAATWSPYSGRASNAPYSIYDGNTALGTVQVNQLVAPNQFNDSGVPWNYLGQTYSITGTTLEVRLTNNANGVVIADGVRIERIGDLPTGPEIQVLDGANDIANATGSVNFGTTLLGSTVTKTFNVKNLGTQDLVLNSPITLPSGFSLVNDFGATTLVPGASTTFAVRLDAAALGTLSGQVSFGNNDADEGAFSFTISGVVAGAVILDDGDQGFTATAGFINFVGSGYQNDVRYALAGNGSNVARWTFSNLAAGTYRVAATWTPYSGRASNSPFTIYDGVQSLGTFLVNQLVAPNGFTDSGVSWNYLGSAVQITSGTLEVRLSDNANGVVIADAIRLERIS